MKVLWEMPVPSGNLLKSPEFQILPKKIHALKLVYEQEDSVVECTLAFHGVEALQITNSLSCSVEQIRTAYLKLVDVGESTWLTNLPTFRKDTSSSGSGLRHLMIYIDDSACYEFICRDLSIDCVSRE